MSWSILFFDLFFAPKRAFAVLKEEPQLKVTTLWFLLVLLLAPMSWLNQESLVGVPRTWGLWLFSSFGAVVIWLLGGAYFHLVAELCGGRGSVKALLSAGAIAQVIQLVALPIAVLGWLLPSFMQNFWLILGSLGISFWLLYLYFLALKTMYGLTSPMAAWVIVSPFVVLIGGFILLLVIGSALVMTYPLSHLIDL